MKKSKTPKFADLPTEGIDLNARSADWPCLAQAHLFAKTGNLAGLRQWLNAGGEVDVLDKEGNTPLLYACWERRMDVERLLLEAGASAKHRNSKRRGVLHNLSNRFTRGDHRKDELLLLLAHDANPLARDREGRNAFDAEMARSERGKDVEAWHLAHLYMHLFDRMGARVPAVDTLIEETPDGRQAIDIIRLTLAERQQERLNQAPARKGGGRKRA